MTDIIRSFADLDPRYRVILCDVWGCLHDGIAAYPEAVARLRSWRAEGRQVILLTNAPRTVEAVAAQLDGMGVPRDCYDGIVTSGALGIAEAKRRYPGQQLGFIGTDQDHAVIASSGLDIARHAAAQAVVCTGFPEGRQGDLASLQGELQDMAVRGAVLLCFNPDRVVMHGDTQQLCAGTIGDAYTAMGGTTDFFGKPYPLVYDYARARAADMAGTPPEPGAILAIGDSIVTDMVGALSAGIDFAFVHGGIHAAEIAESGEAAFLREAIRKHELPEIPAHIIAAAID